MIASADCGVRIADCGLSADCGFENGVHHEGHEEREGHRRTERKNGRWADGQWDRGFRCAEQCSGFIDLVATKGSGTRMEVLAARAESLPRLVGRRRRWVYRVLLPPAWAGFGGSPVRF